jgi:hypothetical protein
LRSLIEVHFHLLQVVRVCAGAHALCCAETFEVVEALLAAGATVHVGKGCGVSPLCSPAAASDERACRALVAAGADVNSRDPEGGFCGGHPLRTARTAAVLALLLAAGASVALAESEVGQSEASKTRDAAACRVLLDAGEVGLRVAHFLRLRQ